MSLKKILNRKISLSKNTFYVLILIGAVIGVLSGIYLTDFLKYLGLDFLADNALLVGLIFMIISATSILTNIMFSNSRKKINVSNDEAFNKQISSLELASSSIKNLENFIQQQKNELLKNKQILEKLNQERNKMSPIVESEKKLVDSILSLHSENQSKGIYKERVIGFLIGLISSSIASLIIWYFTK